MTPEERRRVVSHTRKVTGEALTSHTLSDAESERALLDLHVHAELDAVECLESADNKPIPDFTETVTPQEEPHMTAQPESDDSAVDAFRRIVDAADDYPPGDELGSAVLLHISDLDAEQRVDVIGLLASIVSRLLAGEHLRRAESGDVRVVVDRATRGIVKAAQNYSDLATFDQACRLWTRKLDRPMLAKVTATLAVQLASFYQSDVMSERGGELVALLEKWLEAGEDDTPDCG